MLPAFSEFFMEKNNAEKNSWNLFHFISRVFILAHRAIYFVRSFLSFPFCKRSIFFIHLKEIIVLSKYK